MKLLYVAFCALLLNFAETAQAADLSGQVLLPRGSVAREAVVFLEGAGKAMPLDKVVIDQRNKMFMPHISVITIGTTVSFPNNDTVLHNIFAYYNAKRFDLGVYPRGVTKHVTFDKKGVVALLCNVHSDMSAYIYVVDTPCYALTDDQGRFSLHQVPEGTYQLHAWHESGSEITQPVTIGATNPDIKVALKRK